MPPAPSWWAWWRPPCRPPRSSPAARRSGGRPRNAWRLRRRERFPRRARFSTRGTVTSLSRIFTGERSQADRPALVLALFALLLAPLGLLADKAVVPLVLATVVLGGLLAGPAAAPWRIVDRGLAITVGALCAWCLLAAAWSPDRKSTRLNSSH